MPVSGLAPALSSSMFSPAGPGSVGGESGCLRKAEEESKKGGTPGTSIIIYAESPSSVATTVHRSMTISLPSQVQLLGDTETELPRLI